MSENQPREYDAVLGGDSQAPVDGVVLGGIEGIKQRLANSDIKAKIAGLYQALNYGEAGLDLIIQALWNDVRQVKKIAYSLLEEREEIAARQALEECSDYQFFDCISTFEGHKSKVNHVCIASDGKTLMSISKDSSIIWEWNDKHCPEIISTEEEKGRIIFYASRLSPLGICPNGKTIFTSRRNGKITVWDLSNRKLGYVIRQHPRGISSIAISSDEKTVFSGGKNTIKIWDWQLGINRFKRNGLIKTLEEHSSIVSNLCVTPDGKTLFSGSGDYTIKIWDWQKGELIRTLEGHSLGVNSLIISPDGKTLISGSNDKTIKVWNWKTGKLQATLKGHSAEVNSMVLSPDGKYLFSGSHDKTVKVWGLK